MAYRLDLGGGEPDRQKARRKLLEDLAKPAQDEAPGLADFVYRREVQTLTTLDRLHEVLKNTNTGQFPGFGPDGRPYGPNALPQKLQLIAQLIQKGFGTRVFYVMRDGFDTHSDQFQQHRNLLGEVADGITTFFETLRQTGHDKRVRLMTFSEFGRRIQENASKGTDHGAASCLFVAALASRAARSATTRAWTTSTPATSSSTPTSARCTPRCSTTGSAATAGASSAASTRRWTR